MTLEALREIFHHTFEIIKIVHEVQNCAQSSCKTCSYTDICEATSHLLTVIMREAEIQNKGKLKNDTK